MSLPSLIIGIVSVTETQAAHLAYLLDYAGLKPLIIVILSEDTIPENAKVDIWLANLEGVDEAMDAKLEAFPPDGAPVMYCDDGQFDIDTSADESDLDEAALREQRSKRIVDKLRAMLPNNEDVSGERERAEKLWILAASTGGPDAISQFLKVLPPKLDGVALLYAQHTDPRSIDTLRGVVRRHCQWQVDLLDEAHVVRESTIYIASPTYQLDMLDSGVLSPTNETWSGFYKPSVNQLVAKLARTYKSNGGVIVFSGMGDDGAESCRLLQYRGGHIWVQTAESCTIDSMPETVREQGCVSFIGDPPALARAFVNYHLGKDLKADLNASDLDSNTA